MDTVRTECEEFEPAQLRERTVAYRDLVRGKMKELAALEERIAALDPETAAEQIGSKKPTSISWTSLAPP